MVLTLSPGVSSLELRSFSPPSLMPVHSWYVFRRCLHASFILIYSLSQAWKDEAFELGAQWASLYTNTSPASAELLKGIMDTYYLGTSLYCPFYDSALTLGRSEHRLQRLQRLERPRHLRAPLRTLRVQIKPSHQRHNSLTQYLFSLSLSLISSRLPSTGTIESPFNGVDITCL